MTIGHTCEQSHYSREPLECRRCFSSIRGAVTAERLF